MIKANNYLILTGLSITLEIYRLPILGYNMTFYQLFVMVACFLGLLSLLKRRKLQINQKIRTTLGMLLVFGGYSFLAFLRKVDGMPREISSSFLAEMVGYTMMLMIPLFTSTWSSFRRLTIAFLASAIFVYLGSFWHVFLFVTRRQIVTGVPFWPIFSRSEHVKKYLESESTFWGFPRFRLPFSSPAATGLFLSLAGIFLLVFALYRTRKKRVPWGLILFNAINLICLLGTFARASWVVFVVGSLTAMWYFHRYNIVPFRKSLSTVVITGVLVISILSLIAIGNEFIRSIVLRFNPEYTQMSDIGHLESRLAALRYWAESPIVGLGIGGFWEKTSGEIHTHSTYFTILVERGVIGLFLFLTFLMQIIRASKKRMEAARVSGNIINVVYGVAFVSGLTGLLVGHLLYQMSTDVTWLYYGMSLAYANLRPQQNKGD